MRYTSKLKEPRFIIRPMDRSIDEQRRVKIHPGLKAEFFNHGFETKDPELIEALHNHPARGKEFFEILESDEKVVKMAKETLAKNATPMIQGAKSTGDATVKVAETPKDEVTRPGQTVTVSPEFLAIIDERINAALGTVIELLKKDEKKEEKIMAGKPTKSFKCPYCSEVFSSGFKVGTHKRQVHPAELK